MFQVQFALAIIASFVATVASHGYLIDPPNRASLWRIDPSQPTNYDDSQYFCGGAWTQHGENGGNCGICGDNYVDPQPRSNENTGTYGNGIIIRNYTVGSVIEATVVVVANHLGSFTYSLCVLQDKTLPEKETCFNNLKLADGSESYIVNGDEKVVKNLIQLPEGVTCDQCVLRWHYRCGNSWGQCQDGTSAMGCGNQETFRSCADIRIQ